jgi:hypothetical protein
MKYRATVAAWFSSFFEKVFVAAARTSSSETYFSCSFSTTRTARRSLSLRLGPLPT